jgi:hypothetical protein
MCGMHRRWGVCSRLRISCHAAATAAARIAAVFFFCTRALHKRLHTVNVKVKQAHNAQALHVLVGCTKYLQP